MADRYRLKLKDLRYISAVDTPAQETANVRLVKRKGNLAVDGDFRVAKLNDELGIVFGYAFTSTQKGEDYFDLQGDNVLSDDDMVKAALAFVEGGAMSDEMHDRAQTGTVPFVMPMTPDIAKAFGIEGGEYGLMIGVRPAPDVFAKFKSGELTGFSIDGMGEREPVGKTYSTQTVVVRDPQLTLDDAIGKKAWLTTSVDGHAHLVDDIDYDGVPQDGGTTSWSTSEGDEDGHSHPWVKNTDGTITIGASSGHSHDVVDTTMRPAQAAPAKSTAAATKARKENDMSDALKQEIEALKAERIKFQADLAKFKALAGLTDAEKAYHRTLPESEQTSWLEKSASDRGEDVRKAADADAVVYTATDGTEFRKSDDPRMVEMAKRADAATQMVEKAEKRAQDVELRKSADDDIGHLGGNIDARVELLKAVKGIADEASRKAVNDLLKGADQNLAKMYETVGTFDRSVEKGSPASEWEELVTKRMSEHGESRGTATLKLTETTEGRKAYAARRAAN